MTGEHTQHKNMTSQVVKQYEQEEHKKLYTKEILHFLKKQQHLFPDFLSNVLRQ